MPPMVADAPTPTACTLTAPQGFYAAAATAGLKPSGQPDLALIVSDRPAAAAGVFTRSRTLGAPVTVSRKHLRDGQARAIVVNAGNANAATGRTGIQHAQRMCAATARALRDTAQPALNAGQIAASDVLVGSTGIIGRPLAIEKIEAALTPLATALSRGPDADAAAARAILTTDLATKTAHRTLALAGTSVHIAGIAKGSGMIAPNMATMLAYITTDATIAPELLDQALRDAAAASFNRISVDQHTSPSDMAIVLANGAAGAAAIDDADGDAYRTFRDTLTELCKDLAYQIVRDGEGAQRIFRVQVTGARSQREADRVGKAVVDSPLVKTAVHGSDPNWGRIVTAAGYSGPAIAPSRMALSIGDTAPVCVYRAGLPIALSTAQQRQVAEHMQQKEITFTLDLGRGSESVEWLGCDLSRQYIAINADYTT